MKSSNMFRKSIAAAFLLTLAVGAAAQNEWVNPFIGTSNFGACNPGAVTPNGMMSVSPFNVMGSAMNTWDKDSRWWTEKVQRDLNEHNGYVPDYGLPYLRAADGHVFVHCRL